jgi:hypothetical protein
MIPKLVVHLVSRVLGDDRGQVVWPRVGRDTQRCPGPAFDDARCSTPSRQPQPRWIPTSMGGLEILVLKMLVALESSPSVALPLL